MVVVDEVPGIDPLDLTPGPMKKFWSSGMFLPILTSEDGYGFTYGARVSFVDRLGPRSRISVPLTWGGERQARVQVERSFRAARSNACPASVGIGGARTRITKSPIARRLRRAARIGAAAMAAARRRRPVRRRGVRRCRRKVSRFGGDVTIDTRVDPAFPRNAVHATFGIERLQFDAGSANRRTADVRGYSGCSARRVLAVRGLSRHVERRRCRHTNTNLLGGAANLRGYDAGYKAGDNLAAVSAELRIPVTSPLSIGRFGVKAFVDAGAVVRRRRQSSRTRSSSTAASAAASTCT